MQYLLIITLWEGKCYCRLLIYFSLFKNTDIIKAAMNIRVCPHCFLELWYNYVMKPWLAYWKIRKLQEPEVRYPSWDLLNLSAYLLADTWGSPRPGVSKLEFTGLLPVFVNKILLKQPCSFIYVLSVAAFLLQRQRLVVLKRS